MTKRMLKETSFQMTGTEVTGTYRVSAEIARELKSLRDATEMGTNYHGETTYALYQVTNENGKHYASFIVTRDVPELADDNRAEEHFASMMDADLHTVGFFN